MMSNSTLSQDEINDLLSSSTTGGDTVDSDDKKISDIKNLFSFVPSVIEKVIGDMVSGDFVVLLKDVKLGSKESFLLDLSDDQILDVSIPFLSGISGEHFFVSEQQPEILTLASRIIGQDIDSLEGAGLVSFSEIFNKIGERVCTELSQVLKREIKVGNSDAKLIEKGLSRIPSGDLILIRYILNYEDKEIVLYEIMDSVLTQSLESILVDQEKVVEQKADSNSSRDLGTQKQEEKEGDSVLADTEVDSKSYITAPNVKGVQLPNLAQQGASSSVAGTQNISLLMDVNMELTVELGRTRWQVKDILGMGEGTIIELDKLAGEPVDILVNRNLIARGEVVVIDENFGVRVTEIVSSVDRISDRRI